MPWLLKNEVAQVMQRALKAGAAPTPAQLAQFQERQQEIEAQLGGVPRNLRLAGDTAEIRIEGVLTEKPDLLSLWFGGGNTTYESIRAAIAMAEADNSIRKATFFIHSPGGNVDGLFETLAAIERFSKPKSVRASMADSAAYAIAATAGKIEAVNAASEFGSIGVVVTYVHFEELIDITSTEAPNKRPDPTTEEGQATIREYLDAIHEIFADAIARGRGTTVEDVNANFGRGAVLLAGQAKKRGMIDKIAKAELRAVNVDTEEEAANTNEERPTLTAADAANGEQIMNEEELKAKHPELYKAVFKKGMAQGKKKALAQERDRVEGHLNAGEQSGDFKTAHDAIRNGTEMTQTMLSKYMFAGRNRDDRQTRQTETDSAAGAVRGAGAPPAQDPSGSEAEALGDQVATLVEQLVGKAS